MSNIRIGNDIPLQWTLTRGGTAIDLSTALTKTLYIVTTLATQELSFSVSGTNHNIISCTFQGKDQKFCGNYHLTLVINAGQSTMMTIDTDDCFCLVPVTGSGSVAPVATVALTTDVLLPSNGYSAYQIAVQEGFDGTVEEWLESLIGESLYEMMVRTERFEGTEEEFLDDYEAHLTACTVAAAAANAAASTANATNTAITNAEGLRVAAESARVTAESARATAETTRQSNELDRQSSESSRVTAESSRVSYETTRQTYEQSRRTAETARMNNESDRQTDETARASAETTRQSKEATRQSNETARVTAESVRQTQENSRQTAESARQSAEAARATAETTRQSNETTRQSQEATRQADALVSTEITYGAGSSATDPDTVSEWAATIPAVSAGSYLWSRMKQTYGDGTVKYMYAVGLLSLANAAVLVTSQSLSEAQKVQARANIGLSVPTAIAVTAPTELTVSNLEPQVIVASLTPSDARDSVLFIGDDKAVSVDPDGNLTINEVGVSLVHVIAADNAKIHKTVRIVVHNPYMARVSSTSLRMITTTSFKFL